MVAINGEDAPFGYSGTMAEVGVRWVAAGDVATREARLEADVEAPDQLWPECQRECAILIVLSAEDLPVDAKRGDQFLQKLPIRSGSVCGARSTVRIRV